MQRKRPDLFAFILFCSSFALNSALADDASSTWRNHASAADIARLESLTSARQTALADAQSLPAREGDIIREILNRPSRPADLSDLKGAWRCRVIKLGGMEAAKIYDWFTCRIQHSKTGAQFEKRGGSLHLQGRLYARDHGSYVLLGGMNRAQDIAAYYSGHSPGLGAQSSPNDVVGVLSQIGPNVARLEMPNPPQESDYDVIELRR